MPFELDNQTIKDLSIFGRTKSDQSLYTLLNKTQSKGGAELLMDWMRYPLNNQNELERRTGIIQSISDSDTFFQIDNSQVGVVSFYLNLNTKLLSENRVNTLYKNAVFKFKTSNDFYQIKNGIETTVDFLIRLRAYLESLKSKSEFGFLMEFLTEFSSLIRDLEERGVKLNPKIGSVELIRYDQVFRETCKNQMLKLLTRVYELDVFQSLTKVYNSKGSSFSSYTDDSGVLEMEQMSHPMHENAKPFDLKYGADQNLIFLTGPNMSGKSTFLKALALNFYLAHLGFPVFAKKMKVSVSDGLLTSINLTDNMQEHQSHFLSEVSRVKKAANLLKDQKRMLIIFDELFRGTNVKDAFEGSKMVIEALSDIPSSLFLISTHIVEVAEEVKHLKSLTFLKMECSFEGENPKYTYQLKEGVSDIRLGTHILESEKVLDVLRSVVNDQLSMDN